MTIDVLTAKIKAFRDERDWVPFHNHKDMAAALAIEASELQELFLWKSPGELTDIAISKKELLADELADVAIYLFELADNLSVNLAEAIDQKLLKNAQKYPVSRAQGTNKKYNEL